MYLQILVYSAVLFDGVLVLCSRSMASLPRNDHLLVFGFSMVHFILGRQFMCVISLPIMSSLSSYLTPFSKFGGGREFKLI